MALYCAWSQTEKSAINTVQQVSDLRDCGFPDPHHQSWCSVETYIQCMVHNTCPLLSSRVYLLVVLFLSLCFSVDSVVFKFEALFFKFEEKQISTIVGNR